MQAIKDLAKKAFGVDTETNVTPLKNLVYLGSHFHGYYVPTDFFNSQSICYCIGAGEDITFDTELAVNFGSQVYIFDPMPEGKNHYKDLLVKVARNEKVSVGIPGRSFDYRITAAQLPLLIFIEKGVWDKEAIMKFYEPDKANYPSHSIVNLMKTDRFIEAPVDRLSSFMKQFNHASVDLVKIEIEGAEYTVIDTILEDKADVKMILVEFDEVWHSKGPAYLFRIKKSTNKILRAGYKMVHSTNRFKRTFIRNDIYNMLKAREQ